MAGTRGSGISPVQKEYLDVLRSAIWGETPSRIPSDVKGVLDIANLHKTRPLILDALQKAGLEVTDPHDWEIIYRTTSSHVTLNRYLAKLITYFDENGVRTVLLKGQGVARNYPQPMLRECGDIDLYVGPEQYERACDLMKKFVAGTNITADELTAKHYFVCSNGVYIELHQYCDILKNQRENRFFQGIAAKGLSENLVPITINDVTVNTPADSFNAFFIFQHIWYHLINGGIGFRQICDWILFLHSRAGRLDTSVLDEALDYLKLRSPWQVFGSIAVDYLGLPADEMPFYVPGRQEEVAALLSLILKEGNFGYALYGLDKRPTNFAEGKWFSMKVYLKRNRIFYRLFPERRHLIFRDALYYLFDGTRRAIKHILKGEKTD
ncbi:MAG: nucleotidyltransferase family protein [Bacteroidales bacterium]|nr:nucleotidyltransferase family protein [Bacteroidales bacterium]